MMVGPFVYVLQIHPEDGPLLWGSGLLEKRGLTFAGCRIREQGR